jgi:hypothetical protein
MNIRARLLAASAATTLAAALTAGSAFGQQAQNTVATLSDVQGNVLVSQGDAMVAAASNQRVPAGTRVVTTSGARVTVHYDVGCDVRLNENQRFTVRVGPCAVLLAEVEALGPAAGAIGGGAAATAGVAGPGTAGLLAAGGVIGVGLYETFKSHKISPN